MKKIRVLIDHVLVLNRMTVARGQEIDVWNEEVLDSEEVKRSIEARQIEIIDDQDKTAD